MIESGQPPKQPPANRIEKHKGMDFLDTNTWSIGQTIAIFLIVGGLSLLLALWLAPTVDTCHTFTLEDIRNDKRLRKLNRMEAALVEVRTTKQPNMELRPDWQIVALDGTDFEFELMLVTAVWADNGVDYYRHRLAKSPFRWDIEAIVFQSQNKIKYA